MSITNSSFLKSDRKGLSAYTQEATDWMRNTREACDRARDVSLQCSSRTGLLIGALDKALEAGEDYNYTPEQIELVRRELKNVEWSTFVVQGVINTNREMMLAARLALENLERLSEPELVITFE